MSAHILFVGTGKGSWQIRGKQIGAALGARVTGHPTGNDWAWADVVVLVKHAAEKFGLEAKASGATLIWDVLDWWKQPEENTSTDLMRQIAAVRARLGIDTVIGATQAMADDIGGIYLPHHSRPGLVPAPIRPQMTTVAYEGTPKYLGSWRKALERACAERGLSFVVNPSNLGEADVIVAFRGEQWDGPVCRQWKSGVKYVNALAAGRPVITQPCAAYEEIGTPGWTVTVPELLGDALDHCAPLEFRAAVLKQCRDRVSEFSLESLVRRYRQVIQSAMRQAA